jgi:nitrite reductase (cytochrome c-552)
MRIHASRGTFRRQSGLAKPALLLMSVFLFAAGAALAASYMLTSIFERKQEARQTSVRVAALDEISVDPEPWGLNWPHHYDGWKATAGDTFYGGSSAMPQSKLDKQPWLKRLYAGYAFSIDYREARGHAYMLYDQGVTERITQKPQAGACLHCHASINVLYRKVGLEAMGEAADDAALAQDFNMPAVIRGFRELSQRPYQEVMAMLYTMPNGTPSENEPVFPAPPPGGFTAEFAGRKLPEGHSFEGEVHPVTCIDCHEP